MSRSIFGWSLPPGCGRLPGEEPDPPCVLCGRHFDLCECAPCEVCTDPGCLEHRLDADLVEIRDGLLDRAAEIKRELDARDRKNPVFCPDCKAPLARSEMRGDPHCEPNIPDYDLGGEG